MATSNEHHSEATRFLLDRVNYETFHSIPYSERNLKLDRMRGLLARLGHPEAGLPIVHVAGTKGKGSTCAMLAGMVQAAGYSVGVFSSPHIERVEERLSVDACPAPPTSSSSWSRSFAPPCRRWTPRRTRAAMSSSGLLSSS